MIEGVRALSHLMAMLDEAAAGLRRPTKRVASWPTIGVLIDDRYWIGIAFDDPDRLRFQVRARNADVAATAEASSEPVTKQTPVPRAVIWERTADLGSEDVHFYSRRAVGQMEWLESFLRESLKMAPQMPMSEPAANDDAFQ